MAKVIFVESNTTGTGMIAIHKARALGLEPVLLTNRPNRYRGIQQANPTLMVCDTNGQGALRRAARRVGSGIVGVTTTSEFYLYAAADLAADLGLPGNPPAAVAACRNKAATRTTLRAAGLRQPVASAVRNQDEIESGVRMAGLPCVVKPVDSTGSEDARICGTESEVRERVTAILATVTNVRGQLTARTALIEEYLPGPEFSVEMFSWEGEHRCVGITEKRLTPPPFVVEQRHIYPGHLPSADVAAVADVRRALNAVGICLGPTHTEIRVGNGASIVEINARLAGGMIPELVRLVDGVDLLEQQLQAACGRPPRLVADRHGYAGIQFLTAGREGALVRVAGVKAARRVPGVSEVTITATSGTRVGPPRSAYDRLGYVIARGPSRSAVDSRLDAAVGKLHPELRDDQLMTADGTAGRAPGSSA